MSGEYINVQGVIVFFFQAEDGIRDIGVTGVQTCALPICTHRLLQPTTRFKDLGLVIVDEEQRFGVEHKEYLKTMRTAVDVLSMSATPIPRTLEMSLKIGRASCRERV